jgi:hypothetical protein
MSDNNKEWTDCSEIPDCPQSLDHPEPERDRAGLQSRKELGYCIFPTGPERFGSTPPDRGIRVVKEVNQDRDVPGIFQPPDIRD